MVSWNHFSPRSFLLMVLLLVLPALGAMAEGCVGLPRTRATVPPGPWHIDTTRQCQAQDAILRHLGSLETVEEVEQARRVLTTSDARNSPRSEATRAALAGLDQRIRFLRLHAGEAPPAAFARPLPGDRSLHFDRGGLATTPLPLPPGTWIGAGVFNLQFTFDEPMDRTSRPRVTMVAASGYVLNGEAGTWVDDRRFLVRLVIPTGQGDLLDGPVQGISISGARDLAGNECLSAGVQLLY